jgi:hypothetical protein
VQHEVQRIAVGVPDDRLAAKGRRGHSLPVWTIAHQRSNPQIVAAYLPFYQDFLHDAQRKVEKEVRDESLFRLVLLGRRFRMLT